VAEQKNNPVTASSDREIGEHGGKTLLTMRSVFESAAARDFVVREHHAIEGANQTIDRLRELLARIDGRAG
jgi:hypothetical protein